MINKRPEITFKAYILFLAKYKKTMLVLLGALLALGIAGVFQIELNSDFMIFMPSHSRHINDYHQMNMDFSSGDQLLVLAESPRSLKTAPGLEDLRRIQDKLTAIRGIQNVTGPGPSSILLYNQPLTLPYSDQEVNALIRFLESMEYLSLLTQKNDQSYAFFTLEFEKEADIVTTLPMIEEALKQWDYQFSLSGESYLESQVMDYIIRILTFVPPIAVFLMLLIFRLSIGTLRYTLLSVFPAVIGSLLTMGVLGLLLEELTIITVLVPVFVIVMGSADGLHFMSHFAKQLESGQTKQDAAVNTLNAVGIPMIMTTLTTIAGFLSMTMIDSDPLKQIGYFASAGVLIVGISTILFLPLFCFLVPFKRGARTALKSRISRFLWKMQGRRAVIMTLFIIPVAIPGIYLIQTNFSMLSIYKERTPIRQSIDKIAAVTGGAMPMYIRYETDDNILDPGYANQVQELQKRLLESESVTKTLSVYDFIANGYRQISGQEIPVYPQNRALASRFFKMMQTAGSSGNTFILPERNIGRFLIFPKDFNNSTLKQIQNLADEHSDAGIAFLPVGIPVVMNEMNLQIIPDQIKSVIFAVLIVFLLVLITQKNLIIAVMSIVPILVTLIAQFGIMGYTGIDLSMMTAMMAGITIGVGIDYGIHFAGLYRYYRYLQNDPDPIKRAFNEVSTPILANALGLGFGFTALLLSPFRIHTFLTILMWSTMAVSALLSLTIFPTLLQKFRKKL